MSDTYHLYLSDIAQHDVEVLLEKERTYKGSWKKRGGVGAFMMLARKWDRIENMLSDASLSRQLYDVFDHVKIEPTGADGTVLAEIRDLRRYLLLVEAELVARGTIHLAVGKHDGVGRHDGVGARSVPIGIGDLSRGVPRYQPDERSTPGTPEDGGQHARHPIEAGSTDHT